MPSTTRSEPDIARALIAEAGSTLDDLAGASQRCTACDLYKGATQAVFGEGPRRADVMLVGEQPGDKEDKAGEPFVGPAGRVLDEALERAGVERSRAYVTNAVKHFKWAAKGKQRIHKKPNKAEQRACRPWLDAELAIVRPTVVVCLGATAAQALLGPTFKVTQRRGELLGDTGIAPYVLATVHPSSILRGEPAEREQNLAAMAADLQVVAGVLA